LQDGSLDEEEEHEEGKAVEKEDCGRQSYRLEETRLDIFLDLSTPRMLDLVKISLSIIFEGSLVHEYARQMCKSLIKDDNGIFGVTNRHNLLFGN